MKLSKYVMLPAAILLFVSCGDKEDVVNVPNKEGSIETTLHVKHEANYDLLITTHNCWVNNKLDKTIVYTDTLKALGNTTQEAESSEGNVQTVTIPKDYEFYITVK
jgi:hypothetical protein